MVAFNRISPKATSKPHSGCKVACDCPGAKATELKTNQTQLNDLFSAGVLQPPVTRLLTSQQPARGATFACVLFLALLTACSTTATNTPPTIAPPVIVTLAPRTPEKSATPKPPTETLMPTLSPTPAPSITASGPTVASNAANVYAIATAVPLNVGPFHLVPANTIVDNRGNGLTLAYRTDDGAVYSVVIFLSLTLQDAVDRYQSEVNSLTDKQPAQIGDEAVYAPTDLNLLFVIRFRNAVININRPPANGTVPTIKITADQASQLALLIYNAVPKP